MPLDHEQLRETLQAKGWQEHHIDRAMATLQDAHSAKSEAVRVLDVVIYWGSLGVAVLGNFILSIVLIPVLLAFDDLPLLLSVAVLGAAFGLVLDFVLREIEHLQHSHLIIPELFIPALALINVYIIVTLSNRAAEALALPTTHNPLLVSVMYVCAFILPHFLLKWSRHRQKPAPLIRVPASPQ